MTCGLVVRAYTYVLIEIVLFNKIAYSKCVHVFVYIDGNYTSEVLQVE